MRNALIAVLYVVLFVVFVLGLGVFSHPLVAKKKKEEPPLVLGVFPRFHQAIALEAFRPLTRHLSQTLQRRVVLDTSHNFKQFWEKMKARKFDIVHYNQYHYIRTHKQLDYEVIAMNEERGKSTISATIMIRKDSGVNSIQDLKGKTIHFGGGRQAMISYIYATYLLRSGGLNQGDYVERFANNPPSAMVAAYHGLWDGVAAGVGDVVPTLPVVKKQINPNDMTNLSTGAQFAHLPWAVKKEMPESLKKRVQAVLLSLKNNPKGKKLLKKARLTGLAPASNTDFDPHRKITLSILGEDYF